MTTILAGPARPLLALSLGLSLYAQAGEPARRPGPVVLELFTSQACSSCPPAETLLGRLGLDPRTRQTVLPLAFHVDYWNGHGWVDRLARPEWTQRQREYCRALRVEDGPYTPQLVVDGQVQLNGADALAVAREIKTALQRPVLAEVALAARLTPGSKPALEVSVTASVLRSGLPGRLDLMLAVYESGLATAVERGENRGRTLSGDFVVRRLTRLAQVPATPGAQKAHTAVVALGRRWNPRQLGVAAFLQDRDSLAIPASASVRVAPPR